MLIFRAVGLQNQPSGIIKIAEQSHQTPFATEEEYDAAIHIVTALYLYVTAYNIKWLQPKLQAQVVNMELELPSIGMAADTGTIGMDSSGKPYESSFLKMEMSEF